MLPSSTVENYLKAIYLGTTSTGTEPRLLAMGQLAASLGVTPGTATTMVKTLAESGLVRYEPYSGVALSRAGRKLAARVLRRHRLVELFLVEVMGLPWDEVHDEAELLEHVVSDRLIDRMDEMLGRPEVDPHGDPIPDPDGVVKAQDAQTLLTCPLHARMTVARVIDQDKAFLRFIEGNHLMPGEPIEVEDRSAAADRVRLRGRGDRVITIGTRAASKILVQMSRVAVFILALATAAAAQSGPRPFEITDNSFLVEEAFNQDAGVFQNIATFRMSARNEWDTSFTQEWPLFSRTHQISYTIPYAATTAGSEITDVMVHYRAQLLTDGDGTPAFSPRFSFIASQRAEYEPGGIRVGWQVNLPFSEQAGDTYLHWNLGVTHINLEDLSAHVAASAIWRARPMLHAMMEAMVQWEARTVITISPGVRFGWNRGNSQIVVGVAAPVVWSDGSGMLSGLGYLSYELPFSRQPQSGQSPPPDQSDP